MRRTFIRFFTVADFEEEEIWLRRQHAEGWHLVSVRPLCFYTFEESVPQDVIYCLDYRNRHVAGADLQQYRETGWEYIDYCMGWVYLRMPAAEAGTKKQPLLDNAVRAEMAARVARTRVLPLCCIFLCCILPNIMLLNRKAHLDLGEDFMFRLFGVLAAVYVYLIIYCGIKLKKIRHR